ncbi:MAG: MobF family relaxase [Phycisphaerales bacterium]
MLRVYSSKGGNSAKKYFFSGLMHGDYYAEGQERVGQWWGKGAELLGLRGDVTTRDFCRLVDNQHPATRERLTLRNDLDRRGGYDLTFCPCKSLSIVALLNRDDRLIEAVQTAAMETLSVAEELVQTRVRKNGAVHSRFTNNLAAAVFPHLTARPEAGQLPDPFVHLHAYLINGTFDVEENVWKAIEPLQIKSNAPYLEAVFHSTLAGLVMNLGYEIEVKGKFWEIKGVPRDLVELLSKRDAQINAEAEERGAKTAKEKDGLAAKTRRGKAPEHSMAELVKGWWSQLSWKQARQVRGVVPTNSPRREWSAKVRDIQAARAVRAASEGMFEFSSTVTERSLVERCLRSAPGKFTPEDIRSAIAASGLEVRDLNGVRRVTHPDVYREEREIVKRVKEGEGKHRPAESEPKTPAGLTKDQANAYKHILTSRDQFILVEGRPGTGKTRMAKGTARAINGAIRNTLHPFLGDKVVFLAPTAVASREVLRSEGFKNADTVAKFLRDEKLQSQAAGGWIWLDEAGQLGTKDANALVQLAKSLRSRVIITGDRKQTSPVPRGDFLELLVKQAGVQSQRMEEIVRQTGRMLEIVNAFVQGHIGQAFAALRNDDNLHELPSGDCHRAAAKEYVKRSDKENIGVIVPTHREAGRVTSHVREELRAAGRLGSDRTWKIWREAGLSAAEQKDHQNYKVGQMVRFNQRTPGFEFGTEYEVVKVSSFSIYPFDRRVQVQAKGGLVEALPLKYAERFSVYNPDEIPLATGDLVRITRNSKVDTLWTRLRNRVIDQFELPEKGVTFKKTELANSSVHRVEAFSLTGEAVLEGGKVLPKDFGHLTHGYCRTLHGSQSVTLDSALIVATKDELAPVELGSFLSAATRPRKTLKIFTDDAKELERAASTDRPNIGAIELLTEGVDPEKMNRKAAAERMRTQQYMAWQKQKERDNGREH